jgi:flagellar biosynthesis GTPase FlhF
MGLRFVWKVPWGHMQLNYQQCWCFALSGGWPYAPEITTQPDVLRRTLRRVGGQFIVLAFVLLDVGGLGFALVAPVWLAPWVVINVTVLVLGSLSWSEDRRIQKESATATRRQGAKVRVAEWCKLEELQRKAQRQHQEAEWRQRQEAEERDAQKRLQAALRQAQEQLREAEQRRCQEEKERERQRQGQKAERLRRAQQQRREAEQKRWQQAEEGREAQRRRQRQRKRPATQLQTDWWIVLGVAPSASRDEIVRKYRHKIKQCHPDRIIGIAPELLHLAEEQTKALNGAYANAKRAQQYAERNGAAV